MKKLISSSFARELCHSGGGFRGTQAKKHYLFNKELLHLVDYTFLAYGLYERYHKVALFNYLSYWVCLFYLCLSKLFNCF